jgi:hypothetical protein
MTPQTRALALAIVLASSLGCEATPRPTAATVAGTWQLVSVGGHHLPDPPNAASQLRSSSLELAVDGSFVQSESWIRHRHGAIEQSSHHQARGRWSVAGDSVRLQMQDGGVAAARVSGNQLVIETTDQADGVWEFRRASASGPRG